MAQIHISEKAWKHLSIMKLNNPKKYPNFESTIDDILFKKEGVETSS